MATTRHALPLAVLLLLAAGPLSSCSGTKTEAPTNAPRMPAAGTQPAPIGQGQGEALGTSDGIELAADYQRQCGAEEKPSRDCEILRSLVVAEVTTALQEIERSRDQRGATEALAALDVSDEPEIVIAACRILGAFPATAGIADKVVPLLLESPYIEVQRVVARLLSAISDPAVAELGQAWLQNHDSLSTADSYDEYPDFPAHYAKLGFPGYPGAEWFSPADSDRSIGWSTKDDVAAVVRWFSDTLHADALDFENWQRNTAERVSGSIKGIDQSVITRMQDLTARASRGDQAATGEIEKLQKEIESQREVIDASLEKAIDKAAIAPPSSMRDARWIVAQKTGGRISRLVLIYPIAAVHRTVIQLIWDLTDYPSAWPKTKN